jgi:hypothetical protein
MLEHILETACKSFDWIQLAQVKTQSLAYVHMVAVMNFRLPQKAEDVLIS